jgi:hypothetical protein
MADAPTVLTVIYVLVDDWYQDQGKQLVPPVSALPVLQSAFSDSDVLTLLLALDYFPYPGEQQFLQSQAFAFMLPIKWSATPCKFSCASALLLMC